MRIAFFSNKSYGKARSLSAGDRQTAVQGLTVHADTIKPNPAPSDLLHRGQQGGPCFACQCPGCAKPRQGCLALRGGRLRGRCSTGRILHHTLPRARGTGQLLHPRAKTWQGLGVLGCWGPILHPHSPSPAMRPQCTPLHGQQSGQEKEQEEGQEADIGQKTGLGPANSWKLGVEVRKMLVGVGRWQ